MLNLTKPMDGSNNTTISVYGIIKEISNKCLQIVYRLPKNNTQWINNYHFFSKIVKHKYNGFINIPSVFLNGS